MSWQPRDQQRLISFLAMISVGFAVAMAVFGLPPVDLYGPFHRFGIMDPLCGGTRYTAQGE